MQSQQVIQDIVRRIVEHGSPEKVILYGSHGRGEAGSQSDVDLLVLFDRLQDPRRTVSELYDAVSGSELPKDIVVSTTSDFDRYEGVVNTIFWSAAHEGRVIYERKA